jgi:hypothetical protein
MFTQKKNTHTHNTIGFVLWSYKAWSCCVKFNFDKVSWGKFYGLVTHDRYNSPLAIKNVTTTPLASKIKKYRK